MTWILRRHFAPGGQLREEPSLPFARRQHRPVDLLQGIEVLSKQGYRTSTIARKTGLTVTYVAEVLNLMEKGEERPINAVENGTLPMYLAVRIAESPEEEQKALQEAYELKALRGTGCWWHKSSWSAAAAAAKVCRATAGAHENADELRCRQGFRA